MDLAAQELNDGLLTITDLVDGFEHNLISRLCRTLVRRASGKLECFSRSEYDGGYSPRVQPPIDPDDLVAPSEENDVDREAHEEHVHPHERRKSSVLEQHPRSRLETVTTEQAAALARETAGVFESRT